MCHAAMYRNGGTTCQRRFFATISGANSMSSEQPTECGSDVDFNYSNTDFESLRN
jgi:hypothetical protein